MKITEQWLLEIAGWQVYQKARELWKSGAVTIGPTEDSTSFKGVVHEGKKPLRAMLIASSKEDVKGVCPCRDSRRGVLCPHVIAIGLSVADLEVSDVQEVESSHSNRPNPPEKGRCEIHKKTSLLPYRIKFANNFISGLEGGKLMARILECEGTPTDADRRLGTWIDEHHQGTLPISVALDGRRVATLLKALGGHPRCIRFQKGGGEEQVEISPIPIRLPIIVQQLEEGGLSRVSLRCPVADALAGEYSISGHRLFPLVGPPPQFASEWSRLIRGESVTRPLAWFVSILDELQSCFDVSDTPDASFLDHLHLVPERPDILLSIEGSFQNLTATLTCRYPVAGIEIHPNADLTEDESEAFPVPGPAYPGTFLTRNRPAEQSAIDQLEEAGFRRQSGRGAKPGTWVLSGERAVMVFYGSVLGRLGRIWDVTLGERFAALSEGVTRIVPTAEIRDEPDIRQGGGDWLTFSVRYLGEDGHEISTAEVQRLLRGGEAGTVRMPGGKKAVLDRSACADFDEVLTDCDPTQSSGGYKIRRTCVDYVKGSITSYNRPRPSGRPAGEPRISPAEFAKTARKVSRFLRDYQLAGAAWLADRVTAAGGALLADEMGLGKTLQTLALVAFWNNRGKGKAKRSPALVVCPKSLLENWRVEAGRFVPGLKTTVVKGSPEARARALESGADLFITSYGSLIQDGESRYLERPFGLVILDEAGAIKNPKTKAAKAARALVAEGKVALTGTPVENSVGDLWSIFAFAVPGYLGSQKEFETRYAKPLEDSERPPAGLMGRLRRRVSPYVLRRTKAEVVAELPQKIEKTVFCELTPQQESVYRSILDAAHADIDGARERGGGAAKMAMFTALLRLRQTCCDLRILPLEKSATKLHGDEASAKLGAFRGEVSGVIEAGGRMLCFSQFVSVLQILKNDLEEKGIGFAYLDGQTENRGDVVRTFQEAPPNQLPVFLISLKAGGYGLNLTAANHVVLYDPWWNPAVEAQAIDRAHRIGQESVVTCSRLITRGTVEEKILQLQKRKRAVIDAALEDDQPIMSGLTTQDLECLLD